MVVCCQITAGSADQRCQFFQRHHLAHVEDDDHLVVDVEVGGRDGTRPDRRWLVKTDASATECRDERLCVDARLSQDAAERAALDLTMERHHAAERASSHRGDTLAEDDDAAI